MKNIFNTKYPILSAAMNQVSDLGLALAVHQAGAMPCISSHCYRTPGIKTISTELLDPVFDEFIKQTGSRNCMLSVEITDPLIPGFVDFIKKHRITWIEIFTGNTIGQEITDETRLQTRSILEQLHRDTGLSTMLRYGGIYQERHRYWMPRNYFFSAISVKGNDSAGRKGELSTRELFDSRIENPLPDVALVPMGGVGYPHQVKYYLERGAGAVAVGTLFAACQESPLTPEAKQKMVEASSADIQVLPTKNQNAIILGDGVENDDANRTKSLTAGVTGDGTRGHIFVGNGIDAVNEIRTAQQVVEYLMDVGQ